MKKNNSKENDSSGYSTPDEYEPNKKASIKHLRKH